MFGLPNIRGSCWVNTALQGLFSCPSFKDRTIATENEIDVLLDVVQRSEGRDRLLDLFRAIQTSSIPAGVNIGDTHELIVHLCDKVPWLDQQFRFKVANELTCTTCNTRELREDSVIELTLSVKERHTSILNALQEFIKPIQIEGRDCDVCKEKKTAISRVLLGTFPKILMIHRAALSQSIEYSSILVLNQQKYALFSVLCYNGAHWWTFARHLPPGNAWFEIDDNRVRQMTATQFPVADAMRILLYFLMED